MPTYYFTVYSYPTKVNPRLNILTGRRFDRLLVIGFAGITKGPQTMWHCLCSCGNGTTVSQNHLRSGHTRSCGCLFLDTVRAMNIIHGETVSTGKRSTELSIYAGAKSRCNNANNPMYKYYGERGIEFRFQSFEEFLAEVGRRPSSEYSLDRIDVNGNYESGNIRWATNREQGINRRNNRFLTAFGKTQTMTEWCDDFNLRANVLHTRLKRRWCIECALTIPLYAPSCPHRINRSKPKYTEYVEYSLT